MKILKKIISEAAVILGCSVGAMSILMIVASPIWWPLDNMVIGRIMLYMILAFAVVFTAASLHDEFRLTVRIERRRK